MVKEKMIKATEHTANEGLEVGLGHNLISK